MTMEEERGEGGVGGGEGEEVDAVSDREAQEVRPEAFPRKNFISSIELLHKSCGWRFDLRTVRQSCGVLLKSVKENENFVIDAITSEDSLVLTTLLEAIGFDGPPREPALNLIHRLIAGGLIIGESSSSFSSGAEGNHNNAGTLVDNVTKRVCDCGAASSEEVQLAVLKALLTICTSETFVVKGQTLMQAFKMIFNLGVGSNFELIRRSAIGSCQQLLSVMFRKAAADFAPDTFADSKAAASPGQLPLSGLEVDLITVLERLSRLGSVDASRLNDSFTTLGKQLSITLLKHTLNFEAWDYLSNNFVQRARNLFCVMLVRNAKNPQSIDKHTAVKQIEILCMVILQPRLLAAMKAEAGEFIPLLILRHLEVFSPEPHLLEAACSVLCLLCNKEQLLVDLFVNYDCEMNATNIFERIVKGLCYVITSKPVNYSIEAERKVKLLACKALLRTLTALHSWFMKMSEHQLEKSSNDDGQKEEQVGLGQEGQKGLPMIAIIKNKKDSMSGGIDMFNCAPVKGMKALVNSGVVESTVEAQADFLYKTESLNKWAKGQFLGHHEKNQIAVMHKYADYFDFSGMDFDQAMRVYLDTFRLPGEAQQIDRIMEKFADRYCTCNQTTFQSADQAYTLAYATIMLNTDMHNPLAEHLMSKRNFIDMVNQCPVEGEEEIQGLPEEYLGAIFDRIAATQIKINDEEDRSSGLPASGDKEMASPLMKVLRKALPFQRVSPEDRNSQALPSLDGIKDLLRKQKNKNESSAGVWNTTVNSEVAILMCGTICKHSIDLFDSLDKIKVSMDCFNLIVKCVKVSIIVSGLMNHKDSCDRLVCTLSNLVGFSEANTFALALPDSLRIEAFRSLAEVVLNHPDLLQDSWTHVFRCLSISQHFALQGSQEEVRGKLDRSGEDLSSSNRTRKSELLLFFEAEGLQLIDQLFSGSGSMSGQTIVLFVSAMCAVSREELETPMFAGLELILLQRLVETVYHNLNRIRMVWSRLWAVTSTHLVGAGCEDNVEIAMYSIDALRQMVFKLLEHQELANFKLQDEALKPFVSIFRQSELTQVHVFAVQCILQVVSTHRSRLQSGWHSILACIKVALGNTSVDVVEAALHILRQSWHEPQIVSSKGLFKDLKECFIELMARGNHVEHQSRAIEIVKEGICLILDGSSEESDGSEVILLLCNMGNTALNHKKSCYHVAYQALFSIFARPGLKYTFDQWEGILENLSQTSFIHGPKEDVGEEYYRTYVPLLCNLIQHAHIPSDIIIPKVLQTIQALISKDLPTDLKIFLISQFSEVAHALQERNDSESYWITLSKCTEGMLIDIQSELEIKGGTNIDPGLPKMMLAFQDALSDICRSLNSQSMWNIEIDVLNVLESSVLFAIRYNNELLSNKTAGEDFLLRQEINAGCFLLELVTEMCTKMKSKVGHSEGSLKQGYEMLMKICSKILQGTRVDEDSTNSDSELEASRAPLVAKAVTSCSCVPEEILDKSSNLMLPDIVHYIESSYSDVRCAVSDFLQSKVKPLLLSNTLS